MANKKIQEEILLLAIEEQRRVYDWIADGATQVRIKILALLGGGLTALAFLYSDGQLFIPSQIYGKIFYFAALGMLVFALGSLITAFDLYHGSSRPRNAILLSYTKLILSLSI